MFLTFLPPILNGDGATAIPVVTSHPSSVTAYEYLTATFTVVATGGGLSYQWETSPDEVTWTALSGEIASSVTLENLSRASQNGLKISCVITNSLGSVRSNSATLTVWSPAALTGLQLWLDAADASTVLEGVANTAEDGDAVTQWSDKSGNSRHATASSTACPTYRATGQNGRGSLEFNGTANYLSVGTTSTFNHLHNGTDSLVVCVFKAGTSSNPNARYHLYDSNSGSSSNIGYNLFFDDRTSASRNNGVGSFVARGVGGDAASDNYTQDNCLPNQYNIVFDRIRASNASATARSILYLNGDAVAAVPLIAENTLTGTPSASNASAIARLGASPSGAFFLSGNIAEMIICNDPNTSSWTNLWRYLSQKWNIEISDTTWTTMQRISGGTSTYDAFPSIFECGTDLVCLFRSGTGHELNKGYISRSVSTDGGVNWTVTNNVLSDATYDMRDPFGLVLANGDLLIGSNLSTFSPQAAVMGGVYRSTDKGATWTEVTTIPARSGYNYLFPYGCWVQSGSTIYAPMYAQKTSDSKQYNEIWKTTDEGETWSFHSQIAADYNETAIINTGGTNWLAVARAANIASNQMAYWTSADDMATWSSATLTTFGTSSVSPHLIDWDGEIFLQIGDRGGLDGIKQYKWTGSGWVGGGMLYIAAGDDTGYPSAVIDSSNRMHLVFYHQYTTPGIQHYRITKN